MKIIETYNKELLTERTKAKLKEDIDIYVDYMSLMSQENAMNTKVEDIIMKKYKKAVRCTIYNVRKRVERRLERGELILSEY